MGQQVARHVAWRLRYQQDRYLKGASQELLKQRLLDILGNLLVLSKEAKIGPSSFLEGPWGVALTELFEEWRLRGLGLPTDMADQLRKALPRPRSLKALKAIALSSCIGSEANKVLIKYGREKYLKEVMESGKVRIAPASFYDDYSL